MGIIVVACRSLAMQCLLRFDRGLYQFKDLLAIYHENSSFFHALLAKVVNVSL